MFVVSTAVVQCQQHSRGSSSLKAGVYTMPGPTDNFLSRAESRFLRVVSYIFEKIFRLKITQHIVFTNHRKKIYLPKINPECSLWLCLYTPQQIPLSRQMVKNFQRTFPNAVHLAVSAQEHLACLGIKLLPSPSNICIISNKQKWKIVNS